jgi:DNA (cytosine-5)-methyltransferase 3A
MKKSNLSLFDGCSVAKVAINKSKCKKLKYFSSEIDKYALKVSDKNNKEISKYRLGDMTKLDKRALLKLGKINLLIGGSSCQDFSFIGKKRGMTNSDKIEITSLKQYLKMKKDGIAFSGESYLFWEYVRILNIVKPRYFILENVKMAKKWVGIFESALGVKGVLINSSNFTAQNRERYYFTNVDIPAIEDKKVNLQDILENVVTEKYDTVKFLNEDYKICHTIKPQIRVNIARNIKEILTCTKDFHTMKIGVVGGYADNKIGLIKTTTLRAQNNATYILHRSSNTFRRLTISEREKLQGLEVGYCSNVSDTQAVKITGNSFTSDVIEHILKGIE